MPRTSSDTSEPPYKGPNARPGFVGNDNSACHGVSDSSRSHKNTSSLDVPSHADEASFRRTVEDKSEENSMSASLRIQASMRSW